MQFKLVQHSVQNECFQLISGSLKPPPYPCGRLDQATAFVWQGPGWRVLPGAWTTRLPGSWGHAHLVGVGHNIMKTVAVLIQRVFKICVSGRYSPEGLLNRKRVNRSASPAALFCQTAISSLTANHRRPFWPSHLTRQPSVILLLCRFLHRCCLLTFHELNAVHCGHTKSKPQGQDFKN